MRRSELMVLMSGPGFIGMKAARDETLAAENRRKGGPGRPTGRQDRSGSG